ncbi:hypothetical protein V8G54_004136 [Vigna mungo]|uniref:Uncharacterized protein n=1 Tax=Vigna mungo TaxID=3915 RepID=A0AAQ3SCI1_VIGMU
MVQTGVNETQHYVGVRSSSKGDELKLIKGGSSKGLRRECQRSTLAVRRLEEGTRPLFAIVDRDLIEASIFVVAPSIRYVVFKLYVPYMVSFLRLGQLLEMCLQNGGEDGGCNFLNGAQMLEVRTMVVM